MTRDEYISNATAEVRELFAKKQIVVGYARTPSCVRGTVVVIRDRTGALRFGWSLLKRGDRYNKYVGILKALGRVHSICDAYGPGRGCHKCLPELARKELAVVIEETLDRARAYFGGKSGTERKG